MSMPSSLTSSDSKVWNAFLDLCAKFPPKGWEWLFTPKANVFWFALRTATAACTSLGIAFWMELDNPAWAPLTVGAVAQLTRGESLSKAKYRTVGTIVGCIAALTFTAIFPQHPWLFFPLIALWIAGCTFFGTLNNNFRTYACVLAGYTCAIVSFGAAPDADKVFELTMARGTYILLGIACEATISCLFSANVAPEAKKKIKASLGAIMVSTSSTLRAVINKENKVPLLINQELSSILTFDNKIEFLAVELGNYSHMADHARAALNDLSILTSRAFALAMRLKNTDKHYPEFNRIADEVVDYLEKFPEQIKADLDSSAMLADLQNLRETCRQHILSLNSKAQPKEELDERILFVFLSELMGDLERCVWQYQAAKQNAYDDNFRFQRDRYKDLKLATNNSIRAFASIMVAALWFEITAWPQGYTLLSFTAMATGLFGSTDNPILGSFTFFKGALAGWIAAFFMVLVWQPSVTIFEPLIIIFGGAFFIGGLARGNPKLAPASAAFMLLLSAMLGYQNHHVMNEIAFWNNNLALVSSPLIAVVTFRCVLPYNAMTECRRIRKALLAEVRNLANFDKPASIQDWVSHTSERSMLLHTRAVTKQVPYVHAYLRGTLSTLALGLNIIRLRLVLERDYLPTYARRPILLLLRHIEHMTQSTAKARKATQAAIIRLRIVDQDKTLSDSAHLEIVKALTYLSVIQQALHDESGFLTSRVLPNTDSNLDSGLIEYYS